MQSAAEHPKRSVAGPKPVADSFPIATIAKRARVLAILDHKLRQPLPEALRRQCCLADVRAARIVFLVSSSAWATKLRFYHAAILAEARRIPGLKVEKLTIKVAPLPPVPPEPTRRKPLSKTAAQHLKAAARSLADPELRALYLHLASLAEDAGSNRE